MELHQVIYTSHATELMSSSQLVKLLERARPKNIKLGVTGLLLYGHGSFMQTIEGEFEPVHRLFAEIEADPRHGGVIMICDEPIRQRSFSDWSMAFRDISNAEAEGLAGFRKLVAAAPGTPPERDLARRVMQSFAVGADLNLPR